MQAVERGSPNKQRKHHCLVTRTASGCRKHNIEGLCEGVDRSKRGGDDKNGENGREYDDQNSRIDYIDFSPLKLRVGLLGIDGRIQNESYKGDGLPRIDDDHGKQCIVRKPSDRAVLSLRRRANLRIEKHLPHDRRHHRGRCKGQDEESHEECLSTAAGRLAKCNVTAARHTALTKPMLIWLTTAPIVKRMVVQIEL